MRLLSNAFEILYLNFCLIKIMAKTLILRLKLLCSELRCRQLLLKRSVLVIRQRNAFLEYCCRTVLVNELFKTVKQSHEHPYGGQLRY